MNTTDTTSTTDFFAQVRHATQGLKLTSIVWGLINFSVATAIAWSCSNLIVAIVMFVVSLLIGALIGLAVLTFCALKATDAMVALGAKYEALVEWLSNKFTRSEPVLA